MSFIHLETFVEEESMTKSGTSSSSAAGEASSVRSVTPRKESSMDLFGAQAEDDVLPPNTLSQHFANRKRKWSSVSSSTASTVTTDKRSSDRSFAAYDTVGKRDAETQTPADSEKFGICNVFMECSFYGGQRFLTR